MDECEFLLEINLKNIFNWVKNGADDPGIKYWLYSVIVHYGSINSGHYYVFARESKGDEWFLLEDENVYKRRVRTYSELRTWIA